MAADGRHDDEPRNGAGGTRDSEGSGGRSPLPRGGDDDEIGGEDRDLIPMKELGLLRKTSFMKGGKQGGYEPLPTCAAKGKNEQ